MLARNQYQFTGTEALEAQPKRLKEILQLMRAFIRESDDIPSLASVSRIVDGHPFTREHVLASMTYISVLIQRCEEFAKTSDYHTTYEDTRATALRMMSLWWKAMELEINKAVSNQGAALAAVS